ncbi:MAG: N-substituted formamide deformylase [Planctomycetes bacterium]|nr:N-substituted formamide deformylase [Planctomycetota bacterium]
MAAPDLIVCGARVLGVPGADAVAVAGERIDAVGSRAGMLALRGPDTMVIDRPRALVLPGLHDAHAHLVPLATARSETDLHGKRLDGIRDLVAAAAARKEPGRWIVGRGFDPELFRGSGETARSLLDRAAPRNPVLLRSHDYHAVALNSAGMTATGFLPHPPEMDGGVVDADAAGAPTGILRETSAMAASALVHDVTDAELALAVAAAVGAMHRTGLAVLHDMSGSRQHGILRRLDEAGALGIDVLATVSPEDVGDRALREPGRQFRVVGMKTFLDGALGSRTAHLLEPYEGEPCHCGVEVLAREAAAEAVRRAAAEGLPSYLHAIGDAAVRTALDVLSADRTAGAAHPRHRIEHAQMIHPDDLPRFAANGIAASMQPVHIALDAPLVHRHWGARSAEAFPVRRLLDSGATVAFGSDAPIETFDVAEGIACATSRTGRDGTRLHPEESVSTAEALLAYTAGAAHAAGVERDFGAIRRGAVASLTVLSEDVASHAGAVADLGVVATVVRGRVMHLVER